MKQECKLISYIVFFSALLVSCSTNTKKQNDFSNNFIQTSEYWQLSGTCQKKWMLAKDATSAETLGTFFEFVETNDMGFACHSEEEKVIQKPLLQLIESNCNARPGNDPKACIQSFYLYRTAVLASLNPEPSTNDQTGIFNSAMGAPMLWKTAGLSKSEKVKFYKDKISQIDSLIKAKFGNRGPYELISVYLYNLCNLEPENCAINCANYFEYVGDFISKIPIEQWTQSMHYVTLMILSVNQSYQVAETMINSEKSNLPANAKKDWQSYLKLLKSNPKKPGNFPELKDSTTSFRLEDVGYVF